MLARVVWNTFFREGFDNPSKWKYRAQKSAPECPFECGGEGLFVQCRNELSVKDDGASLSLD